MSKSLLLLATVFIFACQAVVTTGTSQTSNIEILKGKTFFDRVSQQDDTGTLVIVTTPYCRPCKAMVKAFEEKIRLGSVGSDNKQLKLPAIIEY